MFEKKRFNNSNMLDFEEIFLNFCWKIFAWVIKTAYYVSKRTLSEKKIVRKNDFFL